MTSPEADRLRTALQAQYRVEEEIGRGGMGVVVRARDLRLDRAVAIKTLPAHLATDPMIRERFLREARTAASLSHPNIVPIHHADELGDLVFFVMGLVEGASVAQLMRERGPLAPADAIPILTDVAAALGYAHARGVIHRDVKAENILIDTRDGRAMVTDFGIARLAEAAPMTATGTVLGTVHYMSPEQVAGRALDGRSDLYSLGVLAFHMLSGRFPHEHEAPSAVLVAHVMSDAPPLRRLAPTIPEGVASVVDRLLQREAVARYETAADVVVALRGALGALGPDAPAPTPVRLSSTEANAVWERAAVLQQYTGHVAPPALPAAPQPGQPSGGTTGFALEQVRDAAAEAGIDRKYVERALAERAVVPDHAGIVRNGRAMDAAPNRFLGVRTKLEFEAVVDGELSENELAEVGDELRRALGEFGQVSAVGRSLTFTSSAIGNSGTPRKLQVSVTTRGGRTTLRAYEDIGQLAHGVIWGVTGGVGGGLGAVLTGVMMGATHAAGAPFIPLVFLGVGTTAYTIARFFLGRNVASKERELRTALERVTDAVRELVAARRPRLPGGPRE